MELLKYSIVLAILAIAVVTDLRSRRIPNILTMPAAILGLVFHFSTQGFDGGLSSLYGLGLGFGIMVIPFFFGVMGGGDVKLMAAIGAWLGPLDVFYAFLATSILGGVYAIIVLAARRGMLRKVARRFWASVMVARASGSFEYDKVDEAETLPKLAYGLAIAGGTVAVMSYRVLAG